MSEDNSIGIWISDDLPDGLREENGVIEFQCRVCESWTEWPAEIADYRNRRDGARPCGDWL